MPGYDGLYNFQFFSEIILQKITQYKNNIYICITVILWYSRYRIILLS